MLTYETATEVVDLTASAAFLYFPEISRIIDDYDLDRTVASCLEPVEDAAIKQQLRPLVTAAIIDPTNARVVLNEFIMDQLPADEGDRE